MLADRFEELGLPDWADVARQAGGEVPQSQPVPTLAFKGYAGHWHVHLPSGSCIGRVRNLVSLSGDARRRVLRENLSANGCPTLVHPWQISLYQLARTPVWSGRYATRQEAAQVLFFAFQARFLKGSS
jgi:hypothetical protein